MGGDCESQAAVRDNLGNAALEQRVGNYDDDAGSLTLFGLLRKIYEAVTTQLTKADTLQSTADSINGKADNIQNSVNYVSGQIAGLASASGAVKSVQRGYVKATTESNGNIERVIYINEVNPQKCAVLLNVVTLSGTSSERYYLKDVNRTFFTILSEGYYPSGGNGYYHSGFSWQVIEYY